MLNSMNVDGLLDTQMDCFKALGMLQPAWYLHQLTKCGWAVANADGLCQSSGRAVINAHMGGGA